MVSPGSVSYTHLDVYKRQDSFKKMDPQREKDLPPGGKLPAGSTPGSYHPASTAMRPPLSGVMHEGGVVPKTGAYLMKKGEHVLTPEKKNMMHHAMSLASTALSHPDMEEKEPPMPKKSVKEIHIRKGKSGGFIMEHHHAAPAVHPMEEHTAPDMDALHDHMAVSYTHLPRSRERDKRLRLRAPATLLFPM